MCLEEKFAERLAQLRTQKGVSAREMSLSLGQSTGYINNIENKNSLPSMSVFFYICDYFGISPKEFFEFEVSNPTKLNSTINDLKMLTPKCLENTSAVIKDLKK